MPELLLLRHAEAVDKDVGVTDFQRVLTPKGEKQADRIGRLLAHRGLHPDLVVSSPAPRALQTAQHACAALGIPLGDVREEPEVYEASVPTLLDLLRRHGGASKRLMLVGHNPSLRDLGALLSGGDGDLDLGKGDVFVLSGKAGWDRLGQEPMRLVETLEP
jgi:phosphohistidine phosphatase